MSVLASDAFASICEIRHWSLAQRVNDFFLTAFEGDSGEMFCSGRWDREHKGPAIKLDTPRSVMLPVIIRAERQIKYSSFDVVCMDATYRDASGRVVTDATQAATVHSQVFMPTLTPALLRVFMLNAEGEKVLPGYTEFADAEVPYETSKAIFDQAKAFAAQQAEEPVFSRSEPEFYEGDFPGWDSPIIRQQAGLSLQGAPL